MHEIHKENYLDIAIFHHIDINLYPLFIAVYEQKSISKAAQVLCISQSAASHALQRLRLHLKNELFIRSGARMRPTPFAEQIYLPVKHALLVLQGISVLQHQNFDAGMVHNLKIAIHDEIEPLIFPKLIHHFQKLNSDIEFLSSKLDRKMIISDLATQQTDFVIDLEQDFGQKLCNKRLVEDRFVVCTQLPEMSKELYFSAQHIGVSSRRSGVLLEDIYLNRQELVRKIFLRCQHYSTALQVLEQSDQFILTIPKNILDNLHYSKQVQVYELPFELPALNLAMYWHKDLDKNIRHQFLRNEIFNLFS